MMSLLQIIHYPFSEKYIEKIVRILKQYDPFVIVGMTNETKKYSISDYSYSKEMRASSFVGYLDRNIVGYLSYFLKKDDRAIEQQKMALSAVIFLNLFEASYDFSHGTFELYQGTKEMDAVNREICNWQFLNTILHSNNIRYPLDFILSGTNSLPNTSVDKQVALLRHDDLSLPLISWKSAYVHLLKMALLEKANKKNIEGLSEYLQWVIEEYKSDVSCIYFALHFFATSQSSRRLYDSLVKIENTAWDLSFISYWFREAQANFKKNPNHFDILVTNDRLLRTIAKSISNGTISAEASKAEENRFVDSLYSQNDRACVKNLLDEFTQRIPQPSRPKRSLNNEDEKDRMISEFKKLLEL
ncbi:MAG: hypothetical protein ACE5FY_06825 [Nitrospiria bacterium]